MNQSMLPALSEARLTVLAAKLRKSNEVSERYGLSLSDAQARTLILSEAETLRAAGRLEFGEGILPRLIYAFCDSPFMMRENWPESLQALQELFYTFKNDLNDALTDEELLEAMRILFNGKAQGSLLYLENLPIEALFKALRSDGDDEDGEDEADE